MAVSIWHFPHFMFQGQSRGNVWRDASRITAVEFDLLLQAFLHFGIARRFLAGLMNECATFFHLYGNLWFEYPKVAICP